MEQEIATIKVCAGDILEIYSQYDTEDRLVIMASNPEYDIVWDIIMTRDHVRTLREALDEYLRQT